METETEQSETRGSAGECACAGECQCGKYRRLVYYEVDVKQYVDTLNDWD